jgi:hypothetical protein
MITWEPVAIPFARGIKPVSHGRMLDQQHLLTAQNCYFYQDEGPQKRNGHTSRTIRSAGAVVPLNGIVPPVEPEFRTPHSFENPSLSEYWLHGWGLFNETDEPTVGTLDLADQPMAGYSFGLLTRDSEAAVWDGNRLLSVPGSTEPFGATNGAVIPSLRGAPIAKSLTGQLRPDAADTGVLRTVVWIYDSGAAKTAYRSVYNSVTGACIVNEEAFTSLTSPDSVRVFTLGPWTHVAIQDDETELFLRSWHNDTPGTIVARTLGAVDNPNFDVKKHSESAAVVAKIEAGDITVLVLNQYGAISSTYAPTMGASAGTAESVSVATTHDGILGVLWQTTTFENILRTYVLTSGVVESTLLSVVTSSAAGRTTLAANYLNKSDFPVWTVYVDDVASSRRYVRVYRVISHDGSLAIAPALTTTRYNVTLASHAFRVGQRTYVWCAPDSAFTLQPTWFLCDEKLLPVGKALFGLAYIDAPSILTMPSVNWHTEDATQAAKDRLVFVGALGYRQRATIEDTSPDPNGVWAEPSAFFYSLDFLAPLRSAQAGRSTYIAGAQLWEYDGANLHEAGFHLAPEGVSVVDGGAGNLDETKQYNWRVDLCYKNAQNEEIRSWSKTVTVAASAFGAATFKATITIPHVPMTRRDNAYFLVFRTTGDGTEYYLVSSRNPADAALTDNKFLRNDRGSATYTFSDNISDTDLIEQEYHPANADGYLQPLPAPACEIVAAGRDRLWLAGGELAQGEIAPSRYFQPGETPSFSPALNIQVERNAEPVTAIGFVGEQAVFFRKTSAHTLESDGPDNINQGVWAFPRLALSDVGAVSQESLALAGEGLYFQSTAGIRVITQGGGLRPPGAGLIGGLGTDVDTLTSVGEYSAAVVVPKYSQIRWYSRDAAKPTMVVDYTKNVWTTFTGLSCSGAAYLHSLDTVLIAKGPEIWTETEGRYFDGDRSYEMVIKTAWLRAANLGDFQRARRWALFGDADTGLNLRYRIFYDERPFHSFEGTIAFNGNTNTSAWGDSTWGSGSWGDSANSDGNSGLWFRDGVFRFRRRFRRQKCSVFAIELSDQGSNANFSPVVLGLELGRKPGLDRI